MSHVIIHNERIGYLHRSAIGMQLQYTMGLTDMCHWCYKLFWVINITLPVFLA